MHPAVDLDRLVEFSDGTDEGLRTLIRIFLEDITEMIGGVRDAVARGHSADIRLTAHRSAGSSAACGASRLAELLEDLEEVGRSGQPEGSVALTAAIDAELDRVTLFLKTHLASLEKTG